MDMKTTIEGLFDRFLSRNDGSKGMIAIWNGETLDSHCYSQADARDVYECMCDVAKRLANLPPEMPDIVEGHHLIKSGDPLDNFVQREVIEFPETNYEIILIGLGEKGDTVFVIGKPITLVFLAVRAMSMMEQVNQGPFMDFPSQN